MFSSGQAELNQLSLTLAEWKFTYCLLFRPDLDNRAPLFRLQRLEDGRAGG